MMKYEQPSVEIIYMNGSVITTSQSPSLQEGNDEQDYGDWNTNF